MAKQTNPTQPVNTGNQPFDQVWQNTQNWNMEAGSQDITSKDLARVRMRCIMRPLHTRSSPCIHSTSRIPSLRIWQTGEPSIISSTSTRCRTTLTAVSEGGEVNE